MKKILILMIGIFLLIPILALIYAHYEFYFWSGRSCERNVY